MAKDPAVLFYTTDFLASTYQLSDEQVGKFIRLLCIQHIHGRILKVDMPTANTEESKRLLDLFVCDEGGYYNERMEEEILKRKSFCASRQKNKTKANVKAQEAKEEIPNEAFDKVEEQLDCAKKVVAEKEEEALQTNENEEPKGNVSRQKERERQSRDFARFWSAYPKKVAKIYCEKIFYKMKYSTEPVNEMIRAIENQRKWEMWQRENGKYIPNPSTWLSQQRWLDEGEKIQEQEKIEEKRIGIYI